MKFQALVCLLLISTTLASQDSCLASLSTLTTVMVPQLKNATSLTDAQNIIMSNFFTLTQAYSQCGETAQQYQNELKNCVQEVMTVVDSAKQVIFSGSSNSTSLSTIMQQFNDLSVQCNSVKQIAVAVYDHFYSKNSTMGY